ncbi:hypothetical protein [Streptomyces sp. NPDC051561]|uniref:hypothetical protein n=1 Tax=Streptomyces sp. NPDC051561 TaxID=3365658 RepID=UPI003793C8A7
MAEHQLSRQELTRRRRRSGFVGRRAEMSAFRENLERDPADDAFRFLFHVRGNAGVGKTSLVRQWEEVARAYGDAVTAYVDDGVHSPVEAMEAVVERFGRQGVELRRFGKLLGVYRQRAHEAQSAVVGGQAGAEVGRVGGQLVGEGGSGAASAGALAAAQVGLVGLGMVPVVGAFAGAVDPQQIAQGADRLRAALGARLRSHDDVELVLDPVRSLTRVFLEELTQAAAKHAWVVLFFDVYERTGPALDDWLRDLAFGDAYGLLPANVQLVLSGQGRLDARCWGDWLDLVTEVPLEVFTEEETRALLALQGIADERVVEVVLRLSGGLPVLVHTLAQARPGSAEAVDDPSGTAVERFLKWENDPARRAAALACALPLQFDEDVFRAVVPAEAAEEYGWVRRLAFVTDRGGRCRYHQVVRAPMLRHQRTQSPARWRQAHEGLAEMFRAGRRRRQEALPEEEWWADAQWREQRAGETYHLLCADPRRALADALAEVADACEQGAGTVRRWSGLLVQAGEDAGEEGLADWGRRLAAAGARGDGTAADEGVAAALDALLDGPGLSVDGQLRARLVRAWVHRQADRYEQALADSRAALARAPDDPGALTLTALLLTDTGRFAEALTAWSEVLRAEPDRAVHHAYRGYVHLRLGNQLEGLADHDRAIELDPGLDWAYANRSRARRDRGLLREALADADRALAIDPEYAAAHGERAWSLSRLERWDEAVQAMRRAAELEEEQTRGEWHRMFLAGLLGDLGRRAEALVEIDRVLAAREPSGGDELWDTARPYILRAWALHALGGRAERPGVSALDARHRAYGAYGRDAASMADLERAIEIDDQAGWAHAMRGWLAWEAGQLDDAESEFNRALEAGGDWPWRYMGRGFVRVYTGRDQEAVADITRALTIRLKVPEATAESEIARPLVELLREHLPHNRAAVTAAIRQGALLTTQLQWPGLAGQVGSVLALRPSPRLLLGAVGVLRRAVALVREEERRRAAGAGAGVPPGEEFEGQEWTLKLLGPLLRVLERVPGVRG